jgi:hypothetical protein
MEAYNTQTPPKKSFVGEAYNTQIGGSHYTSMNVQPLYFARKNSLPPEILKAIKYVTRNKSENDTEKAVHILQMYAENQKLFPKSFLDRLWDIFGKNLRMPMWKFIRENNITGQRARALIWIERASHCSDKLVNQYVNQAIIAIKSI